MKPKHYHAISATYAGPTNNKGSRVKYHSHRFTSEYITDKRTQTPVLFVSYNYGIGSVREQAEHDLTQMGYTIIGFAELETNYMFFVEEFVPLPKGWTNYDD